MAHSRGHRKDKSFQRNQRVSKYSGDEFSSEEDYSYSDDDDGGDDYSREYKGHQYNMQNDAQYREVVKMVEQRGYNINQVDIVLNGKDWIVKERLGGRGPSVRDVSPKHRTVDEYDKTRPSRRDRNSPRRSPRRQVRGSERRRRDRERDRYPDKRRLHRSSEDYDDTLEERIEGEKPVEYDEETDRHSDVTTRRTKRGSTAGRGLKPTVAGRSKATSRKYIQRDALSEKRHFKKKSRESVAHKGPVLKPYEEVVGRAITRGQSSRKNDFDVDIQKSLQLYPEKKRERYHKKERHKREPKAPLSDSNADFVTFRKKIDVITAPGIAKPEDEFCSRGGEGGGRRRGYFQREDPQVGHYDIGDIKNYLLTGKSKKKKKSSKPTSTSSDDGREKDKNVSSKRAHIRHGGPVDISSTISLSKLHSTSNINDIDRDTNEEYTDEESRKSENEPMVEKDNEESVDVVKQSLLSAQDSRENPDEVHLVSTKTLQKMTEEEAAATLSKKKEKEKQISSGGMTGPRLRPLSEITLPESLLAESGGGRGRSKHYNSSVHSGNPMSVELGRQIHHGGGSISEASSGYTTVFMKYTKYPNVVDTTMLIPRNNRPYMKSMKEAISGVDRIIKDFGDIPITEGPPPPKSSHKGKKAKKTTETRVPDFIKSIVCMDNLSKNHRLEPPCGFGIVMDSTKSIPLKTSILSDRKLFYGTLAFKVPTDPKFVKQDVLDKFSARYYTTEAEEYKQTLLEIISTNSQASLAQTLLPSKERNTSAEDSEEEEEEIETPMMDKYINGRGNFVSICKSRTRESGWSEEVWILVQTNDETASKELYDYLRDIQDKEAGITDEKRGFKVHRGGDDESSPDKKEKDKKESDPEEDSTKSESKFDKSVRGNWANAIFTNRRIEQVRQHMHNTRIMVAIEALSCFGIDITPEDIETHCLPVLETITNDFYHDRLSNSYIYAGSGVTIIKSDTKAVIYNEDPHKGSIILLGPPRSEDTRISSTDTSLSWSISNTRSVYRLFPACTGRRLKMADIRSALKTKGDPYSVPVYDHIVYTGKYEKEEQYYTKGVDDDDSSTANVYKRGKFIKPTSLHYHGRLTTLSYTPLTVKQVKRQQRCGYDTDWGRIELQPISTRIGPEVVVKGFLGVI